jgi:pyruvate dehydrogenase E1 component alpha subunit
VSVEPTLSGAGRVVDAGGVDPEHLYREMVRVRLVEDAVHHLFLEGHKPGTTHLYQRQEAVAVEVCSALRRGDAVAATYRGHGACLALGMPLEALLGEHVASPQARV